MICVLRISTLPKVVQDWCVDGREETHRRRWGDPSSTLMALSHSFYLHEYSSHHHVIHKAVELAINQPMIYSYKRSLVEATIMVGRMVGVTSSCADFLQKLMARKFGGLAVHWCLSDPGTKPALREQQFLEGTNKKSLSGYSGSSKQNHSRRSSFRSLWEHRYIHTSCRIILWKNPD